MADSWTILKENSTLVAGDAWEHLQNQEGGSGTGGSLVLLDGLEVEMRDYCFTIEIDLFSMSIMLESDYIIEIEQ